MEVNQLNSYQNLEQPISSSYSWWESCINYNGGFSINDWNSDKYLEH